MNQIRQSETDSKIKKPTTLDSIPEDISLFIAALVQGWATSEGDYEAKEKTAKARDSALRAISLTSSKLFKTWYPSLLRNVTIRLFDLPSFYGMLVRSEREGSHYGRHIKTIRFSCMMHNNVISNVDRSKLERMASKLNSDSGTEMNELQQHQEYERMSERIYSNLTNLETLLLEDGTFIFNFQQRVNGLSKPHSLFGSLKKLYMPFWDSEPFNKFHLSGANFVWILVFCPVLFEACLHVDITVQDLDFFSQFGGSFGGLSNVRKLAVQLDFRFKISDKRTWWSSPQDAVSKWKGGGKKTEALISLLSVTNQLLALQADVQRSQLERLGILDRSPASTNFLIHLLTSHDSLRHLRLMGPCNKFGKFSKCLFNLFKQLRILTLDRDTLDFLHEHPSISLPPSLEILYVPCHSLGGRDEFKEELILVPTLECRYLPKLNQVVVPSTAIGYDGKQANPSRQRAWAGRRKMLKESEMFTSGRVRLREIQVGEVVGDAMKDEVFMSHYQWLPF